MLLLIFLQSGCTAYTYDITGRFELYIAPSQEYFDVMYSIVKRDVLVTPNEEMVKHPQAEDINQIFCALETKPESKIMQCMILIPYYAGTYCDDTTLIANKVFKQFETRPEILHDSLSTCQLGEAANSPKGGKTGFILGYGGNFHIKRTDWGAIRQAIINTNYKGNCRNPSDIAADGSRCGKRSATSRRGGF